MGRSTCNLPGCLRLAEKVYVTTRAGRWSMVEVRYPRCTDHPLKSYAKTEPLPPQPDAEPVEGEALVTPAMISEGMSMYAPGFDLVDCDGFAGWLSDRLRARTQTRRVSRERFKEVLYWWADHPGDPPWEEVATRLGIEITPEEEYEHD